MRDRGRTLGEAVLVVEYDYYVRGVMLEEFWRGRANTRG